MKFLEATAIVVFAIVLYLAALTAIISVWALIFAFLGWLLPDFFAWVFEVLRTPNGRPWMIGVAIGLIALAFSRTASKGN